MIPYKQLSLADIYAECQPKGDRYYALVIARSIHEPHTNTVKKIPIIIRAAFFEMNPARDKSTIIGTENNTIQNKTTYGRIQDSALIRPFR